MQTFEPPYPQGIPTPPPTRIKVFGILHIVFAGIGMLGGLFQAGMLMFKSQIESWTNAGNSGVAADRQLEFQRAIEAASEPYNIPTIVLSFLLAAVMLVAGIALVRQSRSALKWSNGYAWSSIALKLATIALYLIVLLPAMNAQFDAMVGSSGMGKQETMVLNGMKIGMAVAGVVGPLMYCIYPILALVMLNKPVVKAALGLESPVAQNL